MIIIYLNRTNGIPFKRELEENVTRTLEQRSIININSLNIFC